MAQKKDVVRYKCINYGACAKADANEVIEFPAMDVLGGTPPCPCCHQNTLQEEVEKKPAWPKYAAIGAAALVVLGGGGFGIYKAVTKPETKTEVVKPKPKPQPTDSLKKDSIAKDTANKPQKPVEVDPKPKQEPQPSPTPVPPRPKGINLGYGTYKGESLNGKPHGHGTITYTQTHRVVSSKDFIAEPGDRYEGEFRNGQVSGGAGYLYRKDGNIEAIKP